ncbi:LysM peptidoglycan-binding domain-containing protein, partial [Ralstonia pseudosolanacearum]
LSQEYVVKQGDSLEKIVSQLYGLGPRATPELFAKVATRIQTLNHLSDVDVVPAGAKLEMPDLPPLQWKERNPANLGYGVPRLQSGASYKALLQGKTDGLLGLGDARKILDLGRRAEPLVTQWRWVTVEEAKAELSVASGSVPITLWSQPIT